MENDGEFTSKSTLSRLFGQHWEKYSFDYERTLIPIANALLDVETFEDDDDADTKAYKSLLKFKMSVISENSKKIVELTRQVEEVTDKERSKYHEKLEKETEKFQRSLDFLKKQVEFKDKRIDQLMNDNGKLIDANNRLINQFLDCPLKKGCE
jgi:uncharacterized protein YlxW (UPF0749 family)